MSLHMNVLQPINALFKTTVMRRVAVTDLANTAPYRWSFGDAKSEFYLFSKNGMPTHLGLDFSGIDGVRERKLVSFPARLWSTRLVAHNASFDLNFQTADPRHNIMYGPFHPVDHSFLELFNGASLMVSLAPKV